MTWLRVGFTADYYDPRPVIFPPPGPWWVTGLTVHDDGYCTCVAYLRSIDELHIYWPEAELRYEPEEVEEITFSDRFPRPDWWVETEMTK